MAEEKLDTVTPTSDDLSVLRVLLHTIKGISPISTTDGYLPVDTVDDVLTDN